MTLPVQDTTPTGSNRPTPGQQFLEQLNRVSGALGIVVVGLGLLVIGLGWNGAAGTAVLVRQFPYLLSGGLLGLGLVILGAALIVSQNAKADRARLEARLDEMVEAIRMMTPTHGGFAPPGAGIGVPDSPQGLVVAGSASYHLPDCRLVVGRDDARYLLPVEASERGLAACRVCRPDAALTGSR